jgi:hypothetical protein
MLLACAVFATARLFERTNRLRRHLAGVGRDWYQPWQLVDDQYERLLVQEHPRLPPLEFEARWGCAALRWAQRGLLEAQFRPWMLLAAGHPEGTEGAPRRRLLLTQQRIEEAWACRCWAGYFTRLQIVGGRLYYVPPPATVAPDGTTPVRVDQLRLRAVGAVLLRLLRHVGPLPDADLLLNLHDDPGYVPLDSLSDTESPLAAPAPVPVFSFVRTAARADLLIPFITDFSRPFADAVDENSFRSQVMLRSAGANVDEYHLARWNKTAAVRLARQRAWSARRDTAVFRGTATGLSGPDYTIATFLASARGRACAWAADAAQPHHAQLLDIAILTPPPPPATDDGAVAAMGMLRAQSSALKSDGRLCAMGPEHTLSATDQVERYNYCLYLDGNSVGFRLRRELGLDFAILMPVPGQLST